MSTHKIPSVVESTPTTLAVMSKERFVALLNRLAVSENGTVAEAEFVALMYIAYKCGCEPRMPSDLSDHDIIKGAKKAAENGKYAEMLNVAENPTMAEVCEKCPERMLMVMVNSLDAMEANWDEYYTHFKSLYTPREGPSDYTRLLAIGTALDTNGDGQLSLEELRWLTCTAAGVNGIVRQESSLHSQLG